MLNGNVKRKITIDNIKISVVIPCYKVRKFIESVLYAIPDFVDYIIVIDDKCPQKTGEFVESLNIDKVVVIYHDENQGVGGAVLTGYKKALELSSDIIIKLDGDGQMDPKYILKLIKPIMENRADYTKGNRFKDFKALKKMPRIRLLGNSVLSFLVKGASGYWHIIDPVNGFTAISREALENLNFNVIAKRYFFEIDMLINLNIENMIVKDIAIPALYGSEESSLNIRQIIFSFPRKILKGFLKRILYKYFLYDFNMASLYILFGFPMLIGGLFYGATEWYISILMGKTTPVGTVMLAVLPIILGIEFLLQAINIDINNTPKEKS